jgi:hypothetical protein
MDSLTVRDSMNLIERLLLTWRFSNSGSRSMVLSGRASESGGYQLGEEYGLDCMVNDGKWNVIYVLRPSAPPPRHVLSSVGALGESETMSAKLFPTICKPLCQVDVRPDQWSSKCNRCNRCNPSLAPRNLYGNHMQVRLLFGAKSNPEREAELRASIAATSTITTHSDGHRRYHGCCRMFGSLCRRSSHAGTAGTAAS